MNEQEVDGVLGFIEELWPKTAKMDDADAKSWRRTLARIQHPDIARQALVRLKDTTDYDLPKRERFLDHLSKQTGKPRETQDTTHEAYPGYVQCVEPPPEFPGRKGWFVPLSYGRDVPPDHIVSQHLDQLLHDHQGVYGGQWQIVRDPTRNIPIAEMMKSMHDMKGTVPLDKRIAARLAGLQAEPEYRGVPIHPQPAPKPDRTPPAPVGGSLRAALDDFFANKPPKHQPPPDMDDGPPPSMEEAQGFGYTEQNEPFE